jgi:hypothetical protein
LEDLTDDRRLTVLFEEAARRGTVENSPDGRLRFFAVAVHALRIGENPPALFGQLVRTGRWLYASVDDETAANARIKRFEYGDVFGAEGYGGNGRVPEAAITRRAEGVRS